MINMNNKNNADTVKIVVDICAVTIICADAIDVGA
jgi:hypothetical protein